MYDVQLSYEELILLDGAVSENAQAVIEIAKKEHSIGFDLPVMNEILRKAEETGKLTWKFKSIRSCSHCDKKYAYAKYPRSGRYHNKGDSNWDKPIHYQGVKFNEGGVTVAGSGDMCADCFKKHNVLDQLIHYILDNDLKIHIQKNDIGTTKYLKDDVRVCFECKEEMLESEMGRERTMMGDGTYAATCPHCGAKSLPFGRTHGSSDRVVHRLNPKFVQVEGIE